MNQNDIRKLVQLREFVRQFRVDLDYRGNPLKVTMTKEIVEFTSSVINSVDDLLEGHVTFEGGSENS